MLGVTHKLTFTNPQSAPAFVQPLPQAVSVEPAPPPEKQQAYVQVPGDDYLARGLQQALAAEVQTNEHYRNLAERVERMGHDIADGLRLKDRMAGKSTNQYDIVRET